MKKNVSWQLMAAILLLRNSASLFAGDTNNRNVSMDFNSIEILNKSGEKLKLRDSKTDKENVLNNNATVNYRIPNNEDFQISLNGDGNSDDIVIRDRRGFVEYKADKRSIGGIYHENQWRELLSWTGNNFWLGSFWRLNTVQDSVAGTKAFLIPWIDGKTIKIMVLKSKNGFGRKISLDFNTLKLENKSRENLSMRVRINNKWQDDGKLQPSSFREYKINEVQEISLNGEGKAEDIKINNDKGYIELLASAQMRMVVAEEERIWINHFWWNDKTNKWYGSISMTVSGSKWLTISALEGKQANKDTGIIDKDDVLVFTFTIAGLK